MGSRHPGIDENKKANQLPKVVASERQNNRIYYSTSSKEILLGLSFKLVH
jgi:hypothetical protein